MSGIDREPSKLEKLGRLGRGLINLPQFILGRIDRTLSAIPPNGRMLVAFNLVIGVTAVSALLFGESYTDAHKVIDTGIVLACVTALVVKAKSEPGW